MEGVEQWQRGSRMNIGKQIIKLTRTELSALRWASKARGKNSGRPIMEGFQIFGKRLIGVDGFRIYSVPLPKELENGGGESGVMYPLTALSGAYTGIEVTDESPLQGAKAISCPEDEQVCAFNVNSKFLSEALNGIGEYVTIRVYHKKEDRSPSPQMLALESKDGERIAIIMLAETFKPILPKTVKAVESDGNSH